MVVLVLFSFRKLSSIPLASRLLRAVWPATMERYSLSELFIDSTQPVVLLIDPVVNHISLDTKAKCVIFVSFTPLTV